MPQETLDIETLIEPDGEALQIAERWREWVIYRDKKIEEWKELRNYLFATDTRTTSNAKLPWANSTTTPKLTQIRDNLHANYFDALFPQHRWFEWQADDPESDLQDKRDAIQGYIETKVDQSGFVNTVSQLVLDWIDTGNAFAFVDHDIDFVEHEEGDLIKNYVGPRLRRISPFDIVFNPATQSFSKTPKIIKEIVSLGDLKKRIEKDPTNQHLQAVFDDMVRVRAAVNAQDSEIAKADGYIADGFSSIQHYYGSGYVELLHFFGDLYNTDKDELQTNRIITIVDRSKVLRNIRNPSWLGSDMIRHAAWRERPDNLYGMGPLENLVGLQYRIDHLENLKADVWDQVAFPMLKVQGEVQAFDHQPGERIYIGEEGDVQYLAPDVTALNADQQILDLANKMEELAGAPRMAMGIRTPGEKTAFEVGVLDRGAARVFQNKAQHFERGFLELLLNDMLEVGRRNLDEVDVVRILDEDTGATLFDEVSREDITARGKLRPMGARHFAETAIRLQNLQQLWQMKVNDPSIGAHISGKEFGKILTKELKESQLFSENVAVFEQMETQKMIEESEVQREEENEIATENGL